MSIWKKKKIPCYVLIFHELEVIQATLSFLAEYSDRLEITVIENPSPQTKQIQAFVNELGRQKKIHQYYLFKNNITNNALNNILKKDMDIILKSKYVMISDGDVICNDPNWLDEEFRILKKHPEVYTCGISLDMSNLPLKTFPKAGDWIPADKNVYPDFYETVTATHLQLLRSKDLYGYYKWAEENDAHPVDGAMHKYCEEVRGMKWARTKDAHARHLTWDLYQDLNHPYTKLKLGKTFEETWHHKRQSDYSLTVY